MMMMMACEKLAEW